MDMHIHMSYCTPCGFKMLASNYLDITSHPIGFLFLPITEALLNHGPPIHHFLNAVIEDCAVSYTSKCKNVKINTRGDNRRKVVGICYIDRTYNWFLLLLKVSTLWELVWMLLYVSCSKLPCTCSKRPKGAKIRWFYHQPYPPSKKLNENHQCCSACEM